ncbi:MAG: DoxX-like family protein [Gammaproteobacteria bacterium]|nr:DoxX-like family protein [Gammaproteobacteria bacterium]MDP2139991.1 DoxX-like family protein [Gammaproteobacteria bacterium]MDP2347811.1 DoxX-like family protein [Gammaproteobacteria bacterium]
MPNNPVILSLCRFSIAFIWIYQGVVPKLFGPHADELAINMALGYDESQAVKIAYIGGTLEVLFGIVVLIFHRQRWPYVLTCIAMLGLYLFTVVMTPQFLIAAFNSTTTNLAVGTLSVIALIEISRLKGGH